MAQSVGYEPTLPKGNWRFSYKKAQVSTKITFCGLSLEATPAGRVLVTPSAQRMEDLKALAPPENIPDVRRIVGIFQTFHSHVAGLSLKMPNLQRLAHRSSFTWNEDLQEEFRRAKEAIEKYLVLSPFDPTQPLEMFVDSSSLGFGLVLVHPGIGETKHYIFTASSVAKPVHQR